MVKILELNGIKMLKESNGKYTASTFSKVEIRRRLYIVLIYAYRVLKDVHMQLADTICGSPFIFKLYPQENLSFSFYTLLS